MSEQPKPLSAEVLALVEWIGNKTNLETHEGRAVYLHADDCPSFCDFACNGPEGAQAAEQFDALLFATLDAERERADAAERSVQKLKRAMEYVIERASEITSDHHRDDCPVDYGCESCRLGDIVNDAMSDGEIVAAEKSCEDWQECAGHLALALKNAVHPSVYSAEVAMALAEFDRLAGEATKGVEL